MNLRTLKHRHTAPAMRGRIIYRIRARQHMAEQRQRFNADLQREKAKLEADLRRCQEWSKEPKVWTAVDLVNSMGGTVTPIDRQATPVEAEQRDASIAAGAEQAVKVALAEIDQAPHRPTPPMIIRLLQAIVDRLWRLR